MADLPDILRRACENGFLCLNAKQSAAVEIALWRRLTGNTETFDELIARASDNGFMAVAHTDAVFNKVYLSLLQRAFNN